MDFKIVPPKMNQRVNTQYAGEMAVYQECARTKWNQFEQTWMYVQTNR